MCGTPERVARLLRNHWTYWSGIGDRVAPERAGWRFFNALIASAAVHSGAGSDPRASSLQRLAEGDLDVVFSVDMFNEGLDLPEVGTIMMLRPTESLILWLQQFGRGLRQNAARDKVLTVVDYIGNHRSFLNKPRALLDAVLGLGPGSAPLRGSSTTPGTTRRL
jgi:superfamily II DNA or RNA helicase